MEIILTLFLVLLCVSAMKSVSSPGSVSRFAPGGQYIMLTFSGGPHYYATDKILTILKEKKVKATFFVSGSKSLNHEGILKRMHEDKHEIGSYGFYSHAFTKLTPEKLLKGLHETNTIIKGATRQDVHHCRPPSGTTNADINEAVKSKGNMRMVLWSLDSKDMLERDPANIIKNVASRATPGDIVLLHDTVNQTVAALPGLIDELYRQGYEFVTISEIEAFPDDSPH